MSSDEMLAIYGRLRKELDEAYAAPRWNEGLLDRLTGEISQLEHSLAKQQPHDEQTSDSLPHFVQEALSPAPDSASRGDAAN